MLNRKNYRLKLTFFAITSIFLIFIFCNLCEEKIERCYDGSRLIARNEGNYYRKLDDVLIANKRPIFSRSIFFHESNCIKKLNNVELNPRQACAVESAAFHNNNTDVYVLFASPRYHLPNSSMDPLITALLSYKNIYFRNVDLWSYAFATPIYNWLLSGKLFKSSYLISDISDFLRYLTLWRWGGTYLDLDIVVLRSMENLSANYVGAESKTSLAAGVINFSHSGTGHVIATECLLEFQKNFQSNYWGYNGPGVITRVMKRLCKVNNITSMIEKPESCHGLRIHAMDTFYAIPYENWTYFFEPNQQQLTLKIIENSYLTHLWNKFSSKKSLALGTESAYESLAKKHCPRVYMASREYLKYF